MKKNIFLRASKKIYRICRAIILRPIFAIEHITTRQKDDQKKILACYQYHLESLKKNLCIFSHFDRDNIIDPYVLNYLEELSKNHCNIIFVTTSRYLSITERKKLQPFCHKIIIRKNTGRDFGAFKSGIMAAGNLSFYNKIILANDSVYGPLSCLDKIINYGDQTHLDMWGATDSFANHYHIQSYFVVFSKQLIQHPAFRAFWANVKDLYFRNNIVYRYEIGMSQYFIKKGFKLGSYCSYQTLKESLLNKRVDFDYLLRKMPLNPTHYFWDVLIADYHLPFLKRELVSGNPEQINIANWPNFLKKHTQYNPNLIQQHLNRLSGISTPKKVENL